MQEKLKDIKNGREIDWRKHKLDSLELSKVYSRLGIYGKAERVGLCGSYLEFKKYNNGGALKLHSANFCKVRLCPMCAWRRSLKVFGQVSRVMNYLEDNCRYKYLFLTLTVKNVYGDSLSSEVDRLLEAFNLLTKRKEFKSLSQGWFRCLEVTHDINEFITQDMWYGNKVKHIKARKEYYVSHGLKIGDNNPNYNTYHPHIHMVVAVNKSYFTESSIYLNKDRWADIWKSCLSIDYDPVVYVRIVKSDNGNMPKAIAEVAKYAVKSGDYIINPPDGSEYDAEMVEKYEKLTDDAVGTIDVALQGRRLIAFGGKFKDVHRRLSLDDVLDGDLINTNNDDEIRDDLNYVIVKYNWNQGFGHYIKY